MLRYNRFLLFICILWVTGIFIYFIINKNEKENFALRLKQKEGLPVSDERIADEAINEEIQLPMSTRKKSYFNEKLYIDAKRVKLGEDAFHRHKFNQLASDSFASNRNIPDVRFNRCQSLTYQVDKLPDTSVIITFHNEARSALLRTITSVLNRSPEHLIREIIIVDDFSDDPNDGKLLEQIQKIRVIRNPQREGLIRSRVKGAAIASGEILTFLDSHCECNVGWLEPLLHRVQQNRSRVVCPVIDVIQMENFKYVPASPDLKGGINWNLVFKWETLTTYEQAVRNSNPTHPIETPVIAGGLFSIDRERFYELGSYDIGMNIWGGENIEISFRVWQCHGSLEIIPCSHVGHVFRTQHPYTFPGGSGSVFARNNRRVAEVWMDEYKEEFFRREPAAKNIPFGDIRERLSIRNRLKCHSFQWYLDNVYPDLKSSQIVKKSTYPMRGFFINKRYNMCIDGADSGDSVYPNLSNCLNTNKNQIWTLNKDGFLFGKDRCISINNDSSETRVSLSDCNSENHHLKWIYSNNTFNIRMLTKSDMCITVNTSATSNDHLRLEVRTCTDNDNQVFQFIDSNKDGFI